MKKTLVILITLLLPLTSYAAIAFDNAFSYFGNEVNPSFAYTTAGSNRALIISISTSASSGLAITYGGVAMTQITQSAPTAPCGRYDTLFYLANPASGSNTVAVTGTTVYRAGASYTGVSSNATPDNSAQTTQGTGTTNSNTITPVADNTWHVAIFESGSAGQTASVGTQRTIANGAFGLYDTNASITPPAADTLTVNQTNQCGNSTGVTIAPPSPIVAFVEELLILFGDW